MFFLLRVAFWLTIVLALLPTGSAQPTARDQKEFRRMGSEKMAAFAESWNAMVIQASVANYALATSFWRSWLTGRPPRSRGSRLQNAAFGVLGKGIGPIHRRAVANAKRLARTRLR